MDTHRDSVVQGTRKATTISVGKKASLYHTEKYKTLPQQGVQLG